jgi:flagellum-specific peptidoglycan hydrolase FlgJ
MPLSQTQLDFLAQAAQAAVPGEQIQDVPANLTVPQAIVESGWGAYIPENSWNVFGIKAIPGVPFISVPAHEFVNGKEIAEVQNFESFPSLTAAFSRHAELIATGAPYAAAFSAWQASQRDAAAIEALIRGVAARYSTSPTYAQTLLAIGRMPQVVAAIQEARGT